MMKRMVTAGLVAMTAVAVCSNASAVSLGQNGTTLAAYKTIDVCNGDKNGTWYIYGEISVWNAGAVATEGLAIQDIIEQRVGNQWVPIGTAVLLDPIKEIAAGTSLETATVFRYYAVIAPGSITAADVVRNTVHVTIMNHSGHLGVPWGPSPKATWSGEFKCPASTPANGMGCVLTQGYWSDKPGVVWPASYSRDAMFFGGTQTWQQVLDTPVNASQGYYQLAHQYIAAVLNKANGAYVPDGVQATLDLAYAWFSSNGPSACVPKGSCGLQKTWAAVLDNYNNGLYPGGPGHCAENLAPAAATAME